MTKEDWQLELDRREIERLRIEQAKEKEHRRASKERQDDEELRRAKEELDVIKRREAQAEEEKRIKREIELKRLRDEERAAAEKGIRDKEAKAAVEKYKKEEAERREREEKEKKAADKEYQRRLQEQLLSSGLDEEAINAILKKQKVPEARNERATYTRMPRKHLSIETLRTFKVEYDLDSAVSTLPYTTAKRRRRRQRLTQHTGPGWVCHHQANGSRVGAGSFLEAHQVYSREASNYRR